jgi:hypothetical protein
VLPFWLFGCLVKNALKNAFKKSKTKMIFFTCSNLFDTAICARKIIYFLLKSLSMQENMEHHIEYKLNLIYTQKCTLINYQKLIEAFVFIGFNPSIEDAEDDIMSTIHYEGHLNNLLEQNCLKHFGHDCSDICLCRLINLNYS